MKQTTTTTTTTTGPGGTTTVEQPNNNSQGGGSITNTSGPSPPSPMPAHNQHPAPGPHGSHTPAPIPAPTDANVHTPNLTPQVSHNPIMTPQVSHVENVTPPMPPVQPHYLGASHPPTIPESSSPPIPERNNIRNRLELDSVSPAVQRPNPMDEAVSPITPGSPNRANFSYPSRAPPQGVPRQVPAPHNAPPPIPGHQQPTPQQWGEAWNSQQHQPNPGFPGYDETSRPVPYRVGHSPAQPGPHGPPQKQPTIANLKAAAHGIHVSSLSCMSMENYR